MRAYDRLLEYEIRPSAQRIAIMEYLLSHRTHPTSDEIFEDLRHEIPTLSKTTVYNTLKYFTEKGAVLNLSIDERNARFDGYTHEHAHFLCEKCGHVSDLEVETSPKVSMSAGMVVNDMQVYLRGVCPECVKKENE